MKNIIFLLILILFASCSSSKNVMIHSGLNTGGVNKHKHQSCFVRNSKIKLQRQQMFKQ